MKEIRPHTVRATIEVEVELKVDARTPEEAESVFEEELKEALQVEGVDEFAVELIEIEAFPVEEDLTLN